MKLNKFKLRRARFDANLSQMQAAEIIGISLKAYGRFENGGVTDPYTSTAIKLSKAFNVSIEWLFDAEEDNGKY